MSIPITNIIEYKKKEYTMAFLYSLFISNKNSIVGNIGIFEDLNVTQISIKKDDPY